jgi:hypothetical protein
VKKNNQLAMGEAVSAARQRDVGGSLAAALRRQQRQRRRRQREARRRRTAQRWQRSGSSAVAAAVAAAAVVEAAEDNLLAKAAGNESVDGHMTACDDEIGRWTTTQQPTLSEIASCASCAAMTYQMKIQPCAFWMEGSLIT